MPIYVSFSSTGGKRFLKTGSSLVHGVSHGDNPLKPKDVASLQFGYSVLSPRNVSVGKRLWGNASPSQSRSAEKWIRLRLCSGARPATVKCSRN